MKKSATLKIGITGGIGTGKSTVAKVFEVLGIPVLYADSLAKELMNTDVTLQTQLIEVFGESIFIEGKLQNRILGDIVFNDASQLSILNEIVHPAVIQYSNEWMSEQTTPYALKEAAIMIESNAYKDLDYLIGVSANMEIRIRRTMKRDQIDRATVLSRMGTQMDNDEKMQYCNYVIQNDELVSLIEQCITVHTDIIEKIK